MREFIRLLGASALLPFAAMAQQPGRTYRPGILYAASRDDVVVTAFFEGVRRQGFVEGQNLTVIYHAFAANPDLLPDWAAELVKARVDVIATVGDLATRSAHSYQVAALEHRVGEVPEGQMSPEHVLGVRLAAMLGAFLGRPPKKWCPFGHRSVV
jgi:hypothetical protein